MRGVWISVTCALVAAGACGKDETRGPPTSGAGPSSSVATNGSSGTGGAGGDADPVAAYCDALVTAYCTAAHACCTDQQALDAEFGGDVDTCIMLGKGECPDASLTGIEDAVAAGDATLNQERLDRCTDRLDALALEGPTCTFAPYVAIQLCAGIFVGDGANGAACEYGYECQSGYCLGSTCVDLIDEGDECVSNTTAVCDITQDLHCDVAGSGLCEGPQGSFEDCTNDLDCVSKVCTNDQCDAVMPAEHCDPG